MWVKIDDGFAEHPAIVGLSDGAFRLLVASLCYAARNLTDGRIPRRNASRLSASSRPKHVAELVRNGRWIEHPDHYEVRSFLEFNPSAEQVKRERDATAERVRRHRERRAGNAVTATVRNGVSTPAPYPSPITKELKSSSESRAAVDNPDDDELVQQVAKARARRIGRHDPSPAWINAVARNINPRRARTLADQGHTPAQIDQLLDRPTPHPVETPLDDTGRAQAELMARNERRANGDACPDCGDSGMYLDAHGVAYRCLHLPPNGAA